MSRCFPFPPPGYERKHRPEDLDILKEAKRKEKKHKKDKKDKERKEKDGSDEKHRDKKDRKKSKDKKEKHKDKKDKDKGKDKEKSSISEESTVAEELQDHQKAHSKDETSFFNDPRSGLFQENGANPSQSSLPAKGNEGSKLGQELDRRIRDNEKHSGSQLSERVAVVDKKDQEMAAVRNSSGVLAEEKGGNENKRVDRNMDPQGFGMEFSGNKMVHNLTPAAKSKVEGGNENKRADRNMDPQGFRIEFSGNKMVHSLTQVAKSKVEGIARPVDEHKGRRLEVKEKYKETGGSKKGDKKRDRNKESHGKEKDVEKEKKRDDKVKSKTKNKKSDHNKLKDDVRNDPGCDGGNNSTDLLKDSGGYAANEDNRKRKEVYTNGFLHESEIRPNKKQKPAPHQLIENGRKLKLLQTPTKSSHDKHAAVPNSLQALNRNSLMNGAIEAHKPSPSTSNSSAPIMGSGHFAETSKVPHRDSNYLSKVPPLPKTDDSTLHRDSNYLNKALPMPKMNDSNDSKKAWACPVPKVEDLIAEASKKPPHPDSKYLAEVLTLPNEVDWCEIDDLDWLVSKKDPSRKPTVESVGVEKDLRVWSDAVHIDSADVCALPYVIPY